jgi:hypothetical protein
VPAEANEMQRWIEIGIPDVQIPQQIRAFLQFCISPIRYEDAA